VTNCKKPERINIQVSAGHVFFQYRVHTPHSGSSGSRTSRERAERRHFEEEKLREQELFRRKREKYEENVSREHPIVECRPDETSETRPERSLSDRIEPDDGTNDATIRGIGRMVSV
jgi:hypothetical protein